MPAFSSVVWSHKQERDGLDACRTNEHMSAVTQQECWAFQPALCHQHATRQACPVVLSTYGGCISIPHPTGHPASRSMLMSLHHTHLHHVCRPFLLQSKLSMTQMGLFSMSGYPYSFKLLWSPIVDSVYSAAFGRRKSWIVPVQLMSAGLLMFSADWIQMQFDLGAVVPLTVLFFCFVLLAATQVSKPQPPPPTWGMQPHSVCWSAQLHAGASWVLGVAVT